MILAGIVAAGAATLWFEPWARAPEAPTRGVVTATATSSKPMPPPPAPIEPAAMTAAQQAAFDVWLIGAYRQCWASPKTIPEGEAYLPKIRVAFKADGALAGAPKLVNPPSDPAWRPHADAALHAVKACDPLHVPDKYAAYYPQWKTKTVYFDPAGP